MPRTALLLSIAFCAHLAAQLTIQKTEVTTQVVGEKGIQATTVMEASRGGKPLYTIKVEGAGGHVVGDALFVVARGLEDVEWWTVYNLADGKLLFETHVPVVLIPGPARYAGYEVPEDGDPRLVKDKELIGIVHIASGSGAMRHVPFREKDAKRAELLRSYWDVRRTLTFADGALVLKVHDATYRVPLL